MAEQEQSATAQSQLDSLGQITVALDGQDYVLRPSFAAIMAIERQTRPLLELAQAARDGGLPVEEMGIIVAEMMKAHGAANPDDALARDYRSADPKRVGALIYQAGSAAICARILLVLVGALTGGYTAEGEAKAGTTTNAPIPAAE